VGTLWTRGTGTAAAHRPKKHPSGVVVPAAKASHNAASCEIARLPHWDRACGHSPPSCRTAGRPALAAYSQDARRSR